MKKHCTVFVTCVLLMHLFMVSSVTSTTNSSDQLALLDFRKLITSDPGDVLANNWTTRVSFCTWIGVTCSRRRDRVTALSLYNMSLEGTISPSIGNLSFLVSLDLGRNGFNGNLPSELGNLQRLRLIDMRYNQLEGIIPPTLFQCRALQRLSLAQNKFSGDMPKQLGMLPELEELSLSFNSFTGSIPVEIGNLTKLKELYLGSNNLTGSIPPSIGNISGLEIVSCSRSSLEGGIPQELGNFFNITQLDFDFNNLTGVIPDRLFNISSLRLFAFTSNRLSGAIPTTTGLWLPKLEGIFLADNQLSGEIPISISNASNLLELELSQNFFTGSIPDNLGSLTQLQFINLENNLLSNEPGKLELTFLSSLVDCRSLQFLVLGFNRLNGILPSSVGNLSASIQMFNIQNAQVKGNIPLGIGNLSDMITLVLSNNELSGTIPSTIGQLKNLQRIHLQNSGLQGSIPNELCNLNQLGELHLRDCNISGSIPNCIGNLSRLSVIALQSNKFTSLIPFSLWSLGNLKALNLSHNSLGNELPTEVGRLGVIEEIDLSWNRMSSNIPSTIGDLQRLRILILSHNSFQGPIPRSLGNLITLELVDVSSNALSGTIPSNIQNLSQLKEFNVSFNRLIGEIPNGGVFNNLTGQSILGNQGLCGGLSRLQLPPCATTKTPSKSGVKMLVLRYVLPPIALILLLVGILLWWIRYRVKKGEVNTAPDDLQAVNAHKLISYQELLRATDNFSESNLLGRGGFGTVYKGLLHDGTISAVKVLDLQREGALKSFDVECQVISNIRHRNLIKIISTCSNQDFRALILQYMSNGSLEKWLHSHDCWLDLHQRISVVLDVAMALDYLHNYYSEPVVHCDLKPSNILFDEDMVAHVGDFGITKILAEDNNATQTKTLGTIGYIAPEYGSEGRVSTSCDVYSYGIVVLETFTRKRPTDDLFIEGQSLTQWVNTSYPEKVMDVIDADLLTNEDRSMANRRDCLSSIIELALECSRHLPEERIKMNEVVVRLTKIQSKVLSSDIVTLKTPCSPT